MVIIRRRLIFWLIKAYIKKSGKTIIFSFFLGLAIFFALLFGSGYLARMVPVAKKTAIGIVGAYTQDNLPPTILSKLSRGLTSVQPDGSIKPDLAAGWKETNSGKTYSFYLKPNMYFYDGQEVTSKDLSYNFSDVTIEKPDKYTIVFHLKDAYSPFPVTIAKPIFKTGFIGTGNYQVEDIKLNGDFVQSITLTSVKNKFDRISYLFYPSEDALKIAFLLGEISQASGLSNANFKDAALQKFPNVSISKDIDYLHLVSIFYNTTDSVLSDKKIRIALSYALPDKYSVGKKAYVPYADNSLYYNNDIVEKTQDLDHAKLLLSSSNTASGGATMLPTLTIKTLKKYRKTADQIASIWKKIDIKTHIEEVEGVPNQFQVFLGDFNVPKDPDQYSLWHSDQANNITKYKNLRIDKLLEDGRKTSDITQRKQIYADFQKYLMEDDPAAFLDFPYEYTVARK